MRDYQNYTFSIKEWIVMLIKGGMILTTVAYLFYNSVIAWIVGLPFLYWYYGYEKKQKIEQRRQQMVAECKELMQSVATALNAGYALENTFFVAKEDLHKLYPDKESYLEKECEYIIHNLQVHRTVEELLLELAERTDITEMRHFARVIAIAKRSGGNMIAVIKEAVKNINETMEVKREIQVVIAAKVLEQKIMTLMPFAILAYLRISNPGYLSVLYGNLQGISIMSVSLLIIILAAFWAHRIMDIPV